MTKLGSGPQSSLDRPIVVVWLRLAVDARTSAYARGWAYVMAAVAVAALLVAGVAGTMS